MILSNRTVLVTGGTSGIGLGIAESFLRSKSKVIVCGSNKEKLSTVKENSRISQHYPVMSEMLCKGRNSPQKSWTVSPTLIFWLTTQGYKDMSI